MAYILIPLPNRCFLEQVHLPYFIFFQVYLAMRGMKSVLPKSVVSEKVMHCSVQLLFLVTLYPP